MRPRQSLVEIFSTFLQFEADSVQHWATDTKLRRSMQNCVRQGVLVGEPGIVEPPGDEGTSSRAAENFWSLYWHQQWRNHAKPSPHLPISSPALSLALGHLSAYLQETCYWSVQRAMPRLESSQYKLSDCFQVAIVEMPRILNACDPKQSASLKTYAMSAFGNIVRDHLRQRQEVNLCSHWGLLLKLSRKKLTEALHHAGLAPNQVQQYLLAWTCFESTYLPRKSPGLRQLAAPDRATWGAIAQLYNRQRHQLTVPGAECSPETLEQWLITCANRARVYLYPAIGSLNTPKVGQDSGELQDDLPDIAQESLLTELIAQEELAARNHQQAEMQTILLAALTQLDPAMQELLQLYYQQGLTQQQIAQHLNVQQYTISRKLAKAREALLMALTRWSQSQPPLGMHNISLSTVIKYISSLLEEWLQAYYQANDRSLEESL
ncbi:sigma-70 family RNA polymerase sigma factor [Pantanalinema rosaneae CENA516]|uniref:sigma-70 family RNA polymerase sigma factor n=1 Tax=Pantanalinema rosaneae TaxID=1620701 RepID=UPI003D701A7C